MTSQAAGADTWTAANLVLIAIGAVLAVLVIWWGARLKRERRATEHEIVERAEDAAPVAQPTPMVAASLDAIAPPAPETDPLPVASALPPLPVESAPPPPPLAVAPAPPPLADAPVIATAAPAAAPAPADADDLTLLKGVGPKLATRLGELGIVGFAQVAALTPAEAAALDAQLGSFQGRMARDRWVEQAGYLANDDRAGFEAAFGRL